MCLLIVPILLGERRNLSLTIATIWASAPVEPNSTSRLFLRQHFGINHNTAFHPDFVLTNNQAISKDRGAFGTRIIETKGSRRNESSTYSGS